jgi:thiol-disulfide isomerase/thioredoxin
MTAPQSRHTLKSFWTTPRLALTFVVLALLAAFGVSSCSNSAPNGTTGNANAPAANVASSTKPTVTVNRTAPAAMVPVALPASLLEMNLTDIEGKSLKLSDYAGKVLIVNMWATWCGPCQMETPELVQLHKDYKGKGLEVIGLATAQNDPDLDAVKEFVKKQKVDYKVVYDDGSLASQLAQMAHARGVIPLSFIISRDGHLIDHLEGYSPIATPPKLRSVIDKALSEKQG